MTLLLPTSLLATRPKFLELPIWQRSMAEHRLLRAKAQIVQNFLLGYPHSYCSFMLSRRKLLRYELSFDEIDKSEIPLSLSSQTVFQVDEFVYFLKFPGKIQSLQYNSQFLGEFVYF